MTGDKPARGSETAPTLDDIAAIAEAALATVPHELLRHTDAIAIGIEELCDEQTERDMGLDSPLELLGLYHGRSLDQRSTFDVVEDVDRITLYRTALLYYWIENGETLEAIVRNVIIHEVGHHFGLSDDDMERLEQAAAGDDV